MPKYVYMRDSLNTGALYCGDKEDFATRVLDLENSMNLVFGAIKTSLRSSSAVCRRLKECGKLLTASPAESAIQGSIVSSVYKFTWKLVRCGIM